MKDDGIVLMVSREAVHDTTKPLKEQSSVQAPRKQLLFITCANNIIADCLTKVN